MSHQISENSTGEKTGENSAASNTALPYGTWPSVLTSQLIVSDSLSLDEPRACEGAIFYIERRPHEAGRCVIVRVTDTAVEDMLPAPYSARSRVHEYGGGCYCLHHQQIFFINDSDQQLYRIKDRQINRITSSEKNRYADISYDQKRQRIIAVCETHDNGVVNNTIVSIDVSSGELLIIEQGADFYASPRLNATATRLCWQSWKQPNMPWDGNQLWLADVDSAGAVHNKKHIAGAAGISVFQPQWSAHDDLYYISDDSGWWHLYRYLQSDSPAAHQQTSIEQLTFGEKEFGLPQWTFAQSTYAFIDSATIICCYRSHGESRLALLSPGAEPALRPLHTGWQEFSGITSCNHQVCFIAASGHAFPQLVCATVDSNSAQLSAARTIKTSSQLPLAENCFSTAQTLVFKNRQQQNVYANYYAPLNPHHQPVDDELPPLIVICHGGPTGQASIALDPKKQFWTSRGFALLDVNYSGSSGYGREYRLRLNHRWGELEVADCCDAALYAVQNGLADRNRLIIRGSSAGGFTVLCALTFTDVFAAGASYYGISELTSLAVDTHKFESHYLDSLIGPYPQAKALYQQRSPINHTEKLNCPVIFFQGSEDRVVPKEQAESMFQALCNKGLPVAAQFYAGEQHGFRKAQTIKQSLENELRFYKLVFHLQPAQQIHFIGDILLQNISSAVAD